MKFISAGSVRGLRLFSINFRSFGTAVFTSSVMLSMVLLTGETAKADSSIPGFHFDQKLVRGDSVTFFRPRVMLDDDETSIAISALSDANGLCWAMGMTGGQIGVIQFHPDSDIYAAVFAKNGRLDKVIATNMAKTDEIVVAVTCY